MAGYLSYSSVVLFFLFMWPGRTSCFLCCFNVFQTWTVSYMSIIHLWSLSPPVALLLLSQCCQLLSSSQQIPLFVPFNQCDLRKYRQLTSAYSTEENVSAMCTVHSVISWNDSRDSMCMKCSSRISPRAFLPLSWALERIFHFWVSANGWCLKRTSCLASFQVLKRLACSVSSLKSIHKETDQEVTLGSSLSVCLSVIYVSLIHIIRYLGERNHSMMVTLYIFCVWNNDFMVWKFSLWHHVGDQKGLDSEAFLILDF